jgi:hypothetical protein
VLTLDDTLKCRPGVMSRQTPEGAVLVDMTSGNCFELNDVGRMLWAELAAARDLASLCESLVATFDVPREIVERDVVALAEELQRAGLVEVVQPPADSARR